MISGLVFRVIDAREPSPDASNTVRMDAEHANEDGEEKNSFLLKLDYAMIGSYYAEKSIMTHFYSSKLYLTIVLSFIFLSD